MRSLKGFFALAAMAAASVLAAETARAQVVVTPSYYADGQYVCSYYYPFTCPEGYAANPADYPGDASVYGDAGSTEVYGDPANRYADTGYGYVAGNVNAGGYGYGYDYSDATYAGPAYPCYAGSYEDGYAGCYGYGVGIGVGVVAFDRFHHRHDFDRRFDRRRNFDHARYFRGHDNYLRHDRDRRGFIHRSEFERRGYDHRGFEHRDYGHGFEHRGFPTDHGMMRPAHFNAPHPMAAPSGGAHDGGHAGHRH